MDARALAAGITPVPRAVPLDKRGGAGYTGTYGTAPPPPIYPKHTTVNGSRPGFIAIIILAGLVFFALIGAGIWWRLRRKRMQQSGSASRRHSTGMGRMSGLFRRKSAAANDGRGGAGPWGKLGDDEDDAFNAAPSAAVSMVDLNEPIHGPGYGNGHKWNPLYAASGEDLQWQPNMNKTGRSDAVELPDLPKYDRKHEDA